jgi:TonB family protein
MSDERLFWRNLLIVGGIHAIALVVFLIAGKLRREPMPVQVTWLGSGLEESGVAARASEPQPEPDAAAPELEAPIAEPPQTGNPPPSDLVEPKETIPETPKPATPKPITPKPKPEPTPKPKPSSSPTPKAQAKTSPKPKNSASPKPVANVASRKPMETGNNAEKSGTAEKENGIAGSGNGSGKTGSGSGDLSEFSWYFEMIHDRFYSRWAQPVGLGQDVVATLRLRIMKDGTISNREMIRSSDNPQMDESVLRAAQKLERIDALPKGLGNGEYFDVNVKFKVDG